MSTVAEYSLVERWTGMTWSIQPSPNQATTGSGGADQLVDVSCTSNTSCTAVGNTFLSGNFSSSDVTLVEHWNGSRWSIQRNQNPDQHRIKAEDLWGVSCTSGTACTAVRTYAGRTGGLPLAERWNGAAWSLLPTPPPRQRLFNELSFYAVSCTSAKACMVVGDEDLKMFEVRYALPPDRGN